jgi:hypothetical protein
MRNLLVAMALALGVFVGSPLADTKDHAPTVVQCIADLNLWRSQINEYMDAETAHIKAGTPNKSDVMTLTMRQLNDRAFEMGECAVVDPSKEDEYDKQLNQYSEAREDRYVSFVRRHHLEKQLYQEDEAGMR